MLGLILGLFVFIGGCAGGSSDPPQQAASQQQSQTPATTPPATTPPATAPPATTPPSAPPQETPSQTPPDPKGHAALKNIQLSGVSAIFQSPSEINPAVGPAAGGQEEIALVEDPHRTRDEHTALNVAWRDLHITTQLPQTGIATYQIDNTGLETSILFTGPGTINTEGARFGRILAGETGELTVTAHYTLIAPPGASKANGFIEFNDFHVDLGKGDPEGTMTLTFPVKAGDLVGFQYIVSLGAEQE